MGISVPGILVGDQVFISAPAYFMNMDGGIVPISPAVQPTDNWLYFELCLPNYVEHPMSGTEAPMLQNLPDPQSRTWKYVVIR